MWPVVHNDEFAMHRSRIHINVAAFHSCPSAIGLACIVTYDGRLASPLAPAISFPRRRGGTHIQQLDLPHGPMLGVDRHLFHRVQRRVGAVYHPATEDGVFSMSSARPPRRAGPQGGVLTFQRLCICRRGKAVSRT